MDVPCLNWIRYGLDLGRTRTRSGIRSWRWSRRPEWTCAVPGALSITSRTPSVVRVQLKGWRRLCKDLGDVLGERGWELLVVDVEARQTSEERRKGCGS